MSDFRDALSQLPRTVKSAGADGVEWTRFRTGEEMADAVLAMPEMRAIREVLRHDHAAWCCDVCRAAESPLGEFPSVIAWVIGDNP